MCWRCRESPRKRWSGWNGDFRYTVNEKQKSTTRAALCFLYLRCGKAEKAKKLVSELPHTRESREVIQPLILQRLNTEEINANINLLGNDGEIW